MLHDENAKLQEELRSRGRTHQEVQRRILQEMEEMKKICCAEAERSQQLRIDELSRQDTESQSTVFQFTVHIQELQEFQDVETATSSGLSHIPSHPVIFPNSRGMLSRDFCLRPDTQNLYGKSGNVFENPSAPVE